MVGFCLRVHLLIALPCMFAPIMGDQLAKPIEIGSCFRTLSSSLEITTSWLCSHSTSLCFRGQNTSSFSWAVV